MESDKTQQTTSSAVKEFDYLATTIHDKKSQIEFELKMSGKHVIRV